MGTSKWQPSVPHFHSSHFVRELHRPQSGHTIPFHAFKDVSISDPSSGAVGGAGLIDIGALICAGHLLRSFRKAGFQARTPGLVVFTIENLAQVSFKHAHPAANTCLLDVWQEEHVCTSALVVKSGVAGGKGAP